ncbi:MAG: M48 family metalloprotease [Bdellovibrionales bacterium]|nr:M48 family metalloprotease [Bdellovibrionales bacterium]
MNSATRTWVFLTAMMMLIIVGSQTIGGRSGLLWGVSLALTLNALIFLYPQFRLETFFRGKELEGSDPWGVLKSVKVLSAKARIPTPKVYILDTKCPQAMVAGRSKKAARITLTQGLLDLLTPDELNAIVAYQVASIQRQDIVAHTVAASIVDFLMTIASALDFVFKILSGAKSSNKTLQSHLFSFLISPVASFFLHLEIGSSSYLKTDKLAASWLDDPKPLASALWKLHSYSLTLPMDVPLAMAHFWVINPITSAGWRKQFLIQPGMKTRIKNLMGYYPI